MTITGTIPSAIAAFLKTEDESLSGIEIKGNDIDVILTDKGTYTELYAIGMGNGSYEIIEVDDNLNLIPEYSEGDVISNDVLKKLFSTVINSSLILSFNPLGKIKYGIVDKARATGKAAQKVGNKIKEAGKWVADIISPEDAQNWIRKQKGFGRAKVGKVQRIGGLTGGYYAVLAGNPADKKFSVWKLYRNGNEYRTLKTDFFDKGEDALAAYNKLAGIREEPEETKETEYTETEEVNTQQNEESNVTDISVDDGWQDAGDGFKYKVTAGLKKKKKKSKYNGCNVTGYEDGTLISPMSVGDGGMAVASSVSILNNLIGFLKETKNYEIGVKREQKIVDDLRELSGRLSELAHRYPEVLKAIENNDGGNAYKKSVCFEFDKAGTKVKGTINLSFGDMGFEITPGYSIKDVTRKVEELLNCLP